MGGEADPNSRVLPQSARDVEPIRFGVSGGGWLASRLRLGGMVSKPSFWVLYLMMTLMAFTGLVVTAQISDIADAYGVGDTAVALGLPVVVVAVGVDRILHGATRAFWRWGSDLIGRSHAWCFAF